MRLRASDATTKERLLGAAMELLVETGFAGITTRTISERAGVNNALVHYHFGTKARLLAEAAVGLLGDDMDLPLRMLRDAASVAEGIGSVLAWIGQLDITEPAVRVLIELTIEAFNNEDVRPVVAGALQTGRQDMTAALASRTDVDETTAAPLAALLAALFDGVFLHRMVDADLDVTGWADGAAWLSPVAAAVETKHPVMGVDTAIELIGVRRRFGEGDVAVDALRGIDLSIGAGEFVVLLGPSGSGKTTLLNIIGGIDAATEGTVRVAGVDLAGLDARRVGGVPAHQRRVRVPVLQPHPDLDGPRERGADRRAGRPRPTAAPNFSERSGSAIGSSTSRRRCRAASSNGSLWRVRWPRTLRCCCATSPPAPSTSTPAGRCWRCCAMSTASSAAPWWS